MCVTFLTVGFKKCEGLLKSDVSLFFFIREVCKNRLNLVEKHLKMGRECAKKLLAIFRFAKLSGINFCVLFISLKFAGKITSS